MKLVMIEPLGFSGIRYYTGQLSRHLAQQGASLALVTSRHYERLPGQLGYRLYPVMGGMARGQGRIARGLDYALRHLKVADIVRMERPDLVHVQDSLIPAVDTLLLAWLRQQGLPVVYTAHDVDRSSLRYTAHWRLQLNRAVYRRLYQTASHVLVHTADGREELLRDFGLAAENVSRIEFGNFGLQLEEAPIPSRREARTKLGLGETAPVALFFGDRRHSKGLDLLLAALPAVVAQVPNFRLLIAGESRVEHTTDYGGLIRELGLADYVQFVDRYIPAEEVPLFFAASDLVVLPYRKVYQSGVVHLSYSFGRPVLAARVGGLAEVVDEGETGLLVANAHDKAALAQQLVYAALHRDELERMGHRARELSTTRFGWNQIAATTLALYKELKIKPMQLVGER